MTAGFDNVSWDAERPAETTETQTRAIGAGNTAANQSCKEAPTGSQQTAVANHGASDHPGLRKSQQFVEQTTNDESRATGMTTFRVAALEPKNHRLGTSQNDSCVVLSDSDPTVKTSRYTITISRLCPRSITTASSRCSRTTLHDRTVPVRDPNTA